MRKTLNDIMQSDVFMHLINLTYLPRWSVLLLDMLISLIAYAISTMIGVSLLDFEWHIRMTDILQQVLLLLGVQLCCFWVFRSYAGILRFSTFVDIVKIILGVFSAGIILLIINIVQRQINGSAPFLNSILLIYIFVNSVLLFGWRVFIKLTFEYMSQHKANTYPVMIYGTQSAGLAIAKMLTSDVNSIYRPMGFISDSKDNVRHNIQGLQVHLLNQDLIKWMKQKNIQNVIVSPVKLKNLPEENSLSLFLDNGIKVLTTPHFTDCSAVEDSNDIQSAKIGKIESINVEDLLERPVIQINTENVRDILHGKVVLVTGAAGSIGSEFVRQLLPYHPQLIVLLEQAESPLHDFTIELRKKYPDQMFAPVIADVRQRDMVYEVFDEYKPNIVFHAAAYKHVPLMETFPAQAVLANVLGTKNVADLAVEFGVERFVMLSTDKAVNPTNVMGATKRVAEMYVQALFFKNKQTNNSTTKFITTRFGNVLGSNGSVVPFFKKQIAEGGPVTVTHPDIIRYFMTIPEASVLVMEAAALGEGGEVFCFDMGQPVRIADLAKKMIQLAGYTPGVDIRIDYVGLRPGEKLYEELLNQKELTIPTPNKKITIAKVNVVNYDDILPEIQLLIHLAQQGKVFPTVEQIKKVVPEYKSKNSIFEQLDK